jgi:tRNA U55 pseudouridine synthase TruB
VFNNAVLLVDKPTDWTSFDACNAIKKAIKRLGVAKVCFEEFMHVC